MTDYNRYTVVQLKNILRQMGMRVGGKKAELLQRIKEADRVKLYNAHVLVFGSSPKTDKIKITGKRKCTDRKTYSDCNVVDLKAILKSRKLRVGGNKRELIQRLIEDDKKGEPEEKKVIKKRGRECRDRVHFTDCNVPHLKTILRQRGMSVSGKKKELIKRLKGEKELKQSMKNLCDYLENRVLTYKEIEKRREHIYQTLQKKYKFDNYMADEKKSKSRNWNEFFTQLFLMYDHYFLEGRLREMTKKNTCSFVVCWGKQCMNAIADCGITNRFGRCRMIKIRFDVPTYINLGRELEKYKDYYLNDGGIVCRDVLENLLVTFEHELIHAIIQCACLGHSNKGKKKWTGNKEHKGGHGKRFMNILHNTFGQYVYSGTWVSINIKDSLVTKDFKKLNRVYKGNVDRGERVVFCMHQLPSKYNIFAALFGSEPIKVFEGEVIRVIKYGNGIKVASIQTSLGPVIEVPTSKLFMYNKKK